uniref:chitinase n=1 Tax=Branchiostoma belcheri tsingtauense TaxID=155462 RepID=Q6IWM9_BRABE|nr:variable region-containing chitin-binding protein 4 [Branchiostoma belcheri tsingtauense]
MAPFTPLVLCIILAGASQLAESRCTGKPAGAYQHPDDCSKFYTCAEGGLQYEGISSCPAGLHFDQTQGYCNWANLVTCL